MLHLHCTFAGSRKKYLKRLEAGGWCRRHSEDNKIFVHSLIQLVIKTEIRPINADCKKFLSALWNRHDDKYPPNEDLLEQLAKLYICAAINLGDPPKTVCERMRKIFNEIVGVFSHRPVPKSVIK